MHPDQFSSLFQSINRTTVSLIESLSVLSAVSDLHIVEHEHELHAGMLDILLQNLDIERAALFILKDDTLSLQHLAMWGENGIVNYQHQQGWEQFDTKLDEGDLGQAAMLGEISSRQCRQLSGFFTLAAIQDQDAEIVSMRSRANGVMYVPLSYREQLLAVLCLHYDLADSIQLSLEQFFLLFAKFYVQTVVNFRCVRNLQLQVEQRSKELEQALDEVNRSPMSTHKAFFDELTGLPNKRYFCMESQSVLTRSARYERPFSCCTLSVDGHYDNEVLMALADMLKMQVRETDILAYFGSGQFIVSLPEIDSDGSMQFAERLLQVVQGLSADVAAFASIHISMGLATLDTCLTACVESELYRLLGQSMQAMSQAREIQLPLLHFKALDSFAAADSGAA